MREDEQVARRMPERAFVSLLDADGRAATTRPAFARFLEERRQSGRDLCFVVGGPFGPRARRVDHRLSLGPLTLPHQLARVVLLEQLFRAPQDPRRRALPLLTTRRPAALHHRGMSAVATPVADLRSAARRAVGRAGATAPARGGADARAPEAGRLRRLLDERGDAAGAGRCGAPPRDVADRPRRGARGAPRRPRSSASRSPGPGFLNLVPRRRLVRRGARRTCSPPATASAAAARRRPERINVEFVSRQPDRAAARRPRPQRRLRRRARAAPRLPRATSVHARVLRQRLRHADAQASASPCRRARAARSVPEDGYAGRLRRRARRASSTAPRRCPRDELGAARRSRSCSSGMRATLHRFRRRVRRGSSASARCTTSSGEPPVEAARFDGARASRAAPTATRARCGCARRTFGDDKDRVLERSNGEHTYFASDIAYQQDKRERGFDRLIDVWGADHHGYVARMKAACAGARRRSRTRSRC